MIHGIQNLDLNGKKVLIRVDFNVPCDQEKITDDTRMTSTLPTIRYVLEHGGLPILLSHRGRPKGKRDLNFSLAICTKHLEKLLGTKVLFADDCVGDAASAMIASMKKGEVILLENLRFYEAEEKPEKDPSFAEKLASLGDCYINEAFASSHRAHSSIVPLAHHFSADRRGAGFLLQKEIEFLGGIFKNPQKPLIALIGGAKVSTKIKAIESLLPYIDGLLIGGGMAYTFLKAQGKKIGLSLLEQESLGVAAEIIKKCAEKKIKLLFPIDCVVVSSLDDKDVAVASGEIPDDKMGVDIGPQTIDLFKEALRDARTIFWNGPMGVFENPLFAQGTNAMAHALAESKAVTVAGGGETVEAIHRAGLENKFKHISTGGGASIEFIEQMTLPGIEALK